MTKDQGHEYLKIIKKQTPFLLDDAMLKNFLKNDALGSPKIHDYSGFGRISPTTLRYIKVASDIFTLFGASPGSKMAEIGCGYGGQALVLDAVFKKAHYVLFDLLSVCALIEKYLEFHVLDGSYETTTINKFQEQESQCFDLVVSNYAFSELPKRTQMTYVDKVLSKSKKGYLTMNEMSPGRLSAKDLGSLLPKFEIFKEQPLTNPKNYIISWGHEGRLPGPA